jgi:hypothetical protein
VGAALWGQAEISDGGAGGGGGGRKQQPASTLFEVVSDLEQYFSTSAKPSSAHLGPKLVIETLLQNQKLAQR